MFNTKLLTYNITIRKCISNRLQKFKYKNKLVLGVVVSNLVSGLLHRTKIIYSRNTGEKCTANNKRNITPYKVIKCVEFLEQEGYVVNFREQHQRTPSTER